MKVVTGFLSVLVLVIIGIACSMAEPTGQVITPVYVTVNATSVDNFTGLLADGQHPLPTEVIAIVEAENYISLDGVILTANTIKRDIDTNELNIFAGSSGAKAGALRFFSVGDGARQGEIWLSTPNNAETASVARLRIGGSCDNCEVDWSSVYHTGIAMGDSIYMASNAIRFVEMIPPGADAANFARMYAFEGAGDNLTDMAVVFQDGTVDIFAQETTPLNAPIFRYPSGTVGQVVLKKPHAGIVSVVMVFPDGTEFVLKQIEYHDAKKITANKGVAGALPSDWIIRTAEQRKARANTERITDNFTGTE